MKSSIHLILGLLLLIISPINAQYVFRDITLSDGLSDNQIRSISMLPDKRMAIGTRYILNIYDGSSIYAYNHDKSREYNWANYKPPREYYDSEGRIWLKNYEYLLLFDLNTNQYIYNIQEILQEFGIKQKLINLFIDDSKNYWFITEDKTVLFYNIQKKELTTIMEGGSEFIRQHGIPRELVQYKNLYWIIFSDGLICCWDSSTMEITHQDDTFLSAIDDTADKIYIYTTDKDRLYLHTTDNGNLWLMLSSGIYHYDSINKKWKEICQISGYSNFFTCMDLDCEGNVWAGTSASGLRFINKDTYEVKDIDRIELGNGEKIFNDIFSVFIDDDNGVWVGTLFKGLYYYHPSMRKFNLHRVANADINIASEDIWCFLETDDNEILVGAGKGLFKYNPLNGIIEQVYKETIGDNICISLYQDRKKRIWVSTFFNGLYCIDKNSVRNYKNKSININSYPNTNNVRSLFQDESGNFWICVLGGVGKFDEKTGNIEFIQERHKNIKFNGLYYKIYEVERGNLLVIGDKELFYYNTQQDSVYLPDKTNQTYDKFPDFELAYTCYHKDSRGLEWFGTTDGLRIWDNASRKLYTINTETGLQNNIISAILEDNDNMLWVSTVNGISKITVTKTSEIFDFSLVNFDKMDGLQSGKFNERASLIAKDGTFYFGGVYGFNSFNPDNIVFNESKTKAIFTNLSLFNTPIYPEKEYNGHVILNQAINKTEKITLSYKENFITLEFSGLNYVNPQRTYFKYKLENFDSDWNEIVTTGSGKVTYTELPSGTYRLIVHTANNDKIWSDEVSQLVIEITPPFWATSIAITLYIVICLAILVYLYIYLQKRNERKLEEQKIKNEIKQKEEMEQMKYRFFTNVSHEFRTPLTLIITPLETLLKQEKNEELKNRLNTIYKNAQNLLDLVNQLLDFRKLEMKGEKLRLYYVDIKQFIQNIYDQFEDSVKTKNIDFIFEFESDDLSISIDENKIHKVITNLLSNALKYTPSGGIISMVVNTIHKNNSDYLKISVADTGKGIPQKDKEKIFNRFYQIENTDQENVGSGIGLHLAKEYITMHNGEIYVENQKDGGAVFTLLIPVDLKSEPAINPSLDSPTSESDKIIKEESSEKETLLIVEDNVEFRLFLVEQLSSVFKVIHGSDGEEGEKLAIQQLPDLIISDLMMPKVDGVLLCKRLKNNIQTSHIPFILLTARHSDEAKIEGYQAGADSYIPKPFSMDVLLTRIKNLIEQQKKRRELFQKTIEVSPESITITTLDEEFVQKTLSCIEKNMDKTEYSVEDLSKDLGLSRVHLYRKLQSITGQNPSEFVRSIRLKKAAQLLRDSQLNISEIAYEVGFTNPKYFTTCFKEEFGVTPTQFKIDKSK